MIVYVDTTAAMKLLVEEKESAMLAGRLHRRAGRCHAGGFFVAAHRTTLCRQSAA